MSVTGAFSFKEDLIEPCCDLSSGEGGASGLLLWPDNLVERRCRVTLVFEEDVAGVESI